MLAACDREFAPDKSPFVEVRAESAWRDTLALTDTDTLSAIVVLGAEGDTLSGMGLIWTSSDPAVLSLTPLASDEGETFPRRARVLVTARARGRVEITVSLTNHGFPSAILRDSIVVLERWIAVSAGDLYACGLTVEHDAYCWGSFSWALSRDSITPQRMGDGLKFSSIGTGADHMCGVRNPAPNVVYCWGDGRHGELGTHFMDYERLPVPVSGGSQVRSVVAGHATTCAVLAPGTGIDCWGYASTGQLVDALQFSVTCAQRLFASGNQEICSPRAVNVSAYMNGITVGRTHSCGIESQIVYCWGGSNYGQLGTDPAEHPELDYPCQFREFTPSYLCAAYPLSVEGVDGVKFSMVAAAGYHTCALSAAGSAYCWGRNDHGQLGDGSQTDRVFAGAVVTAQRFSSLVVAGGSASASTAAAAHTCALSASGDAYCWGDNRSGQLGDGTLASHLSPVMVTGGQTFMSLSAGAGANEGVGHTCGVRRGDGAMLCWGDNSFAQLGQGVKTPSRSSVPVRVMEPPK